MSHFFLLGATSTGSPVPRGVGAVSLSFFLKRPPQLKSPRRSVESLSREEFLGVLSEWGIDERLLFM